MIDESFRTAQKFIDQKKLINLAKNLIAIPSHHGLKNPEKEIADYIDHYLTGSGLESEKVTVIGDRKNVIASYGSGRRQEKTLMLEGHMDTVDVTNMTAAPFSGAIRAGKIYGRGSVDMKGALAAMITALAAVKEARIPLAGKAYFAGVIDEELDNEGAIHIAKNGPITSYAIVGEPTGLEIHNGHRGLAWLEIKVKGKYAHGGTPEKGINAIEKINTIMTALKERLEPELTKRVHPVTGPSTMTFNYIAGGTRPSTIPGECLLRIDRRWIPGESHQMVIGEIQEIIDHLKESDKTLDASINILHGEPGSELPPLVCNEESCLIKALKEATGAVIGKTTLNYFPAWTDGSLLARDGGIETVIFGPGQLFSAHSEEEFCPLQDIIDACRVYLYVILKICR